MAAAQKSIEEKYAVYERLLGEWNDRMNLVAPSTLADARRRHIEDSAQLSEYIPPNATAIDLGSGAGFPAVVLAILGRRAIAVESTGKKCRFLETLKKELDLPNLTIINDRIEAALPKLLGAKNEASAILRQNRIIFTARAFAPLIKILDMTAKYRLPYALLKGENVKTEIALAQRKYGFEAKLHPSRTGPGSIVILTLK